jgi:hypothetical protein
MVWEEDEDDLEVEGEHWTLTHHPSVQAMSLLSCSWRGASRVEAEMETDSRDETDSRHELEVMQEEAHAKKLKTRGEVRVSGEGKEPKTHEAKSRIIPASAE